MNFLTVVVNNCTPHRSSVVLYFHWLSGLRFQAGTIILLFQLMSKKISDFSVKRIHQKSLMYIYYNFYSLNDFIFFSVLELFSVFKQAQVFTKENERQYNKDMISIMLFHSFMCGKLKTVKLTVDVFIVSSSSLLHLSLCNLLRCNLTSVCRYCSLNYSI